MLKSKKNVFWEALLITIGIFLIGIFLGMLIETSNSNKMNLLYLNSEINFVDGTTLAKLSENFNLSCENLREGNINFANSIYKEAKLLEQYESSGRLTEDMKLLHKKYDLLRTLLWMSNQESLKRCHNYNLIVYLYDYETGGTDKKAIQNVWSKVLLKITKENNNILLLPIAADRNLVSLDLLIKKYKITQFPAVIINNKKVLYKIKDASEIKSLLN